MRYPKSIQRLIEEFTKLPTVGPKTAERYVLFLLRQKPDDLKKISEAIAGLREGLNYCRSCFLLSESPLCEICSDEKRDNGILCIVATSRDLITLEKTNLMDGRYHILGGHINPIEGILPENLTIQPLINRLKNQNIKEVIIALDFSLEGETTAMYLAKLIKPLNIKLSRLAKGLPMGSDLEYADEMTLSNALRYRNVL